MTTPRDAIALLERADPVDALTIADENEVAAAHDRVRRMIAETPHTARRRRPARLAVLAAAATAAVAFVVAALPGHSEHAGLGPLNAVAAIAAKQPSTVAPAGKYFHVLEEVAGYAPVGQPSRLRTSYEWWVAADGSGRLVYRTAPWGRGSAPRGCGCRQVGDTLITDRHFGPGHFADVYRQYADLADPYPVDAGSLPTDPGALRRHLESNLAATERRHASRWSGAAKHAPAGDLLLPEIAWLLGDPMDSPALRSALYRVAAELPGVSVQRHVADPAGRVGEAMTVDAVSTVPQPTSSWPKFRTIFDPRTSEILAWEVVFTPRSTAWVTSRTFLERGIVSSTHATP